MLILSSLVRWVQPFVDLILPRRCAVCGEVLSRGQHYICTRCRLDAPLTNFWAERENPMAVRIKSIRPDIEEACSLLYFIRGSRWRKLIHRFKYSGEWYHGYELGRWLGAELRESKYYESIDTVVAIPLHPLRQIWRGYNQSDYIAYGIAKSLGAKHLTGVVGRRRYNHAQVKTSRDERWGNVENLFRVNRPSQLSGRNVLLVDDLFTTGATMLSCAETIMDAVPDCRVWVATVAVSNREFGLVSRE